MCVCDLIAVQIREAICFYFLTPCICGGNFPAPLKQIPAALPSPPTPSSNFSCRRQAPPPQAQPPREKKLSRSTLPPPTSSHLHSLLDPCTYPALFFQGLPPPLPRSSHNPSSLETLPLGRLSVVSLRLASERVHTRRARQTGRAEGYYFSTPLSPSLFFFFFALRAAGRVSCLWNAARTSRRGGGRIQSSSCTRYKKLLVSGAILSLSPVRAGGSAAAATVTRGAVRRGTAPASPVLRLCGTEGCGCWKRAPRGQPALSPPSRVSAVPGLRPLLPSPQKLGLRPGATSGSCEGGWEGGEAGVGFGPASSQEATGLG